MCVCVCIYNINIYIDTEMITYVTRYFENNEVCDVLTKEWETDCTKEEEISTQIFNKKEDFFLNNSRSEYRNKPNRDKNGNRTRDDGWFEKRKETVIQEVEAEVKL